MHVLSDMIKDSYAKNCILHQIENADGNHFRVFYYAVDLYCKL